MGVWTVTWFVILAGLSAVVWLLVAAVQQDSLWLGAAFVAALLFFVAVVYFSEGYSPQCLELSDERVSVVCRYRTIDVPRADIMSIERVAACRVVILLGTPGIFGYVGVCFAPKFGWCRICSTSLCNLYCIKTATANYIIGCPDRARLFGGQDS